MRTLQYVEVFDRDDEDDEATATSSCQLTIPAHMTSCDEIISLLQLNLHNITFITFKRIQHIHTTYTHSFLLTSNKQYNNMPIRSLSTTATVFVCAILAGSTATNAFVPTTTANRPLASTIYASSMPSWERPDQFFFTDDRSPQSMNHAITNTSPVIEPPKVVAKKTAGKSGGAVHKQGVFSPIVQLTKMALGDEKLNKLRAKVISLHSDIISNFVNTADTALGNVVLRQLFEFADKDKSGTIDETELRAALLTLGFDWLQEKQIKGIFERADIDTNGAIDLNEWMMEAPRTLRTNLIKLAKKNGGDMGLLV
jgi:EF-hand domain